MLYECWRQIAQERRNEVALRDLASGQFWTFGQLDRETETPDRAAPAVYFPQGHSVEFVRAVLRAWRNNASVCLLEPEAHPPSSLPALPARWLLKSAATPNAPDKVAFTEEQLAADARNIVEGMGLRADWPNLGVVSLGYSYGFSNLILPLLLHGIPLFLSPSPLPEILRTAAQGQGALTLPAVPALWHAWQKSGVILRNVRLAISAAAPMPLALELEVFKTHGLKIHNFYGASECGGISYDATETPRANEASVGRPLGGVQVAISPHKAIVVTSRAVGETYWPDAFATLKPGRFQTSDLGELKDGVVYLRGHAGDQISIAGRKVSPTIIETKLRAHRSVGECLVFSVPTVDRDRKELIVACVVRNGAVQCEDLKQFLLSELPSWQVPREWWFVKSLGVDARGRVSRAQWRSKFLARQARDQARS